MQTLLGGLAPVVRHMLMTRTAAWLVPTIIACGFVVAAAINSLPGGYGDTVVLVHGAHTIAYCLAHGIHSNCDRVQQRAFPGLDESLFGPYAVGPYALFQYLPALLLTQLGLSDNSVYSGLTLISLLSFCAVIGLGTWTAAITGRRWAPSFMALLLTTSPLLYYAAIALGESLAVLLVSLLAVASLRRWPPVVIALCAFLACITKDTAFPIVAMLGAAALWATPIASRQLRREHWYGLACGIALGLAATAAFNWLRWRQVTNWGYLQSWEQVPGIGRRLGIGVTLWISPNGGVAIYWPLAALLIIVAIWAVATSLRHRTKPISQTLPGMGIIVSILLITAILASWYSPLGGYSWGPRLMLPTLPAALFIVIALYGNQLENLFGRLLGDTMWAGLFAVGVIAIALPNVNILHAQDTVSRLYAPDATCPTIPNPATQQAHYYMCINHWAWSRHWTLLDTMRAVSHTSGVIFAAAFVMVWVALIIVTKSAFTSPRSTMRPRGRSGLQS